MKNNKVKELDVTKSYQNDEATVRRDDGIVDALQQARYILSRPDLIPNPEARVERAKFAIDEALRLMRPLRS